MTDNAPRIDKAEWTFTLRGDCIYCGKACTRTRTYVARTPEDAAAQADASMPNLCHRKCGGY